MMKRTILYIFFIISPLTIYSQSFRELTINQITTPASETSEVKIREWLQFLNLFIQENYANKAFPLYKATPVYLTGSFDRADNDLYITYSSRMDIDDFELDKFKEMINDGSITPPCLEIGVNPNNIEETLKLLEYGLKKEKKLKNKFWKVLESSKNTDTIIIKDKGLKSLLTNPPSKKITKFLQKYSSELKVLQEK